MFHISFVFLCELSLDYSWYRMTGGQEDWRTKGKEDNRIRGEMQNSLKDHKLLEPWIKMKFKYMCPNCQYISFKKWNVERHVRNVHRIKDFSNGSNKKPNTNQQNIRPTEYVQFNFENCIPEYELTLRFQNGSNEKPNNNQQKIRPTEIHTDNCPNDKSREILQKIALLLLKEYKVIRKPIIITSKGVSILE